MTQHGDLVRSFPAEVFCNVVRRYEQQQDALSRMETSVTGL